jgi:PKD repeat protein
LRNDVDTQEFHDNSANLDGKIVRWFWEVGDGSHPVGGPSADGRIRAHRPAPGICTVTLYAIDDDGGLSSVRQIISVTSSVVPVGGGPEH